jgi:hypothetical protein
MICMKHAVCGARRSRVSHGITRFFTVSQSVTHCHTVLRGVKRCHTLLHIVTRVWLRVPRREGAQLHHRPVGAPATVSQALESNGYGVRE